MKKLCVIGDPVEHSLSPLIQNSMITAAGLDCVYEARTVAGSDTAKWLERAVKEGYTGFNATMPHKENLVRLMDELSEEAALCGAVNTVCITDGKAYGHNTDGEGFVQALRQAGMEPEGKNVLVLGAGGAARAVVLSLIRAGANTVRIANRTVGRAEELCALAGNAGVRAAAFDPDTLKELARDSDLVVNCTSLGMTGVNGQFESLDFLECLRPGAGVFDLIYSPARTPLLTRAQQLGLKTSNGLAMLVWQGIYALERFAGIKLDGPAMAAVAFKELEGRV